MEDALVKRLEMAVSRLERVESAITQRPSLAPKPTTQQRKFLPENKILIIIFV